MTSGPPVAVLEIIRTFNAPREVVFDAFRSFEAIRSWLSPAECQVQSGFPSEESRDNHGHGWNGSFDKLAARS